MIQEPVPNSVRGKQRIWQRSKRLQDDWMLQVATVPHERIAGLSQRFQVSPIIGGWLCILGPICRAGKTPSI